MEKSIITITHNLGNDLCDDYVFPEELFGNDDKSNVKKYDSTWDMGTELS